MKTELEKKLNKLPASIYDAEDNGYDLEITKYKEFWEAPFTWRIQYIDYITENVFFSVEHSSLQAAVDNILKEIKKL